MVVVILARLALYKIRMNLIKILIIIMIMILIMKEGEREKKFSLIECGRKFFVITQLFHLTLAVAPLSPLVRSGWALATRWRRRRLLYGFFLQF